MRNHHYDVSRDDKITVSYQSILLSISDHIRLSAWKIINPFILYCIGSSLSNIMILSCRLVTIFQSYWCIIGTREEGRLLCLLFLIIRICYHCTGSDWTQILLNYLWAVAYWHTNQLTWFLTPEVLPDCCLSHRVIIVFIFSSLNYPPLNHLHHNIFCAGLRPNQVSNVKTCHGELSWN